MTRNAGQCNSPCFQFDHKQNVVCNQTSPGQDLGSKEVYSGGDRHVRGDEVLPCGGLPPFRSGCDSVPAQHVADSLIRDLVSEVRKSARDAIVSPAGVLPRQPNNKARHFGANRRSPRIQALFGAVELLSNQFSEPATDGPGRATEATFSRAFDRSET
jgi:hypothetical protein